MSYYSFHVYEPDYMDNSWVVIYCKSGIHNPSCTTYESMWTVPGTIDYEEN